MTALLCAIFLASGVSALIFETLWFHQAGLAFGNSVWTSSLVLSAFMGGLALGNALAARYGDRLNNAVGAYAIAEVAIALSGVGLVYLFPIFGVALAPWLSPLVDRPWILNPVRLLIAFGLLLIPSTAMGVTLPMLTKALTLSDRNFGRVLGRLYGWNTLGAVIGAVTCEMYLIGVLGIRGTALAAGAVNMAAASVAAWLSTATSRQTLASRAPVGRRALPRSAGRRWLAAAFLSGFCLLALEVVWFRFLVLFVMGHSVAFAVMLGVVLSGIALGGLAASQWLGRSPDAHRFAAAIAFSAGVLCIASYAAFPMVITSLDIDWITRTLDILRVGIPLMFPVSFLSGALFTLVGAALRANRPSETETTGVLTLANTAGAALGSFVGGFLLLPVVGMEKSFFLIAVLYGGVGALLLFRGQALRIAYASAAVFLVGAMLFPFGSMETRLLHIPAKRWVQLDAGDRVVAVREGLSETIIYLAKMMLGRPVSYVMATNALSMSGTPIVSRRYMKLYVYWPMAVHPNLKRALLICYGIGNTAKAMTDSRSIETIDVVDRSRDILEMNHVVYPDTADNPLFDPRVRTHVEDGRYFLQTTKQQFDLITAEPPPPGNAGVEHLYSREYFQLLSDRLADGGIVTYWLPLHELTDVSTRAILRAFCDVFDDCSLWNGNGPNLMMVGTRHAEGPVSEEQFIRQWTIPVVAAEMERLGFERPEQLGALFIGDADYLRGLLVDATPLVDNYPKVIEAPVESREEFVRLRRGFIDAAAAQERFRRSLLIKHLWPERLLTASLPYFEFQNIITDYFYGNLLRRSSVIEDVHSLLTRSSLSTPVLWRLGSDSDIQRVVAAAEPGDAAHPAVQFQLGLRFLSERHYAMAVEPLTRAEQLEPIRRNAFQLRLYALCMSGQIPLAQQLARERFAHTVPGTGSAPGAVSQASPEPYWVWMKQTFGIELPD